MAQWQWYWHRLRAMSLAEMLGHARTKLRQWSDARGDRDWASVPLESSPAFPALPPPNQAPEAMRQSLAREVERILAGCWRAFGYLDLRVDDPPKWHRDCLVGKDLATSASAFKLNHRALPEGADIKLVWELSRWHALVRLAQAACVLGHEHAAEKCVLWLEDWVKHNPPFRGWNWTSPLEAGLRLIQFTWIDALLAGKAEAWGMDAQLDTLRYEILPAHVWFAWRYPSLGSSANNHRIGELAGLIVATARWPALASWGAPLDELQPCWEREVLAQFAPDGGNCEQALNYQLFSWELCWQARMALNAAGRMVAPAVEDRLRLAATFFVEVQVPEDPWDYGDSDSALVAPLVAEEATAVAEWHQWFRQPAQSPALNYWLGTMRGDFEAKIRNPKPPGTPWTVYPDTGQAIACCADWTLRLDVSPLGYLKTAAHGHLDALHLAIWKQDVALVIDPGTGAYFADPRLRNWLASRSAHNGPCPAGTEFPERLGPFLWAEHHDRPACEKAGPLGLCAVLTLPEVRLQRTVHIVRDGKGCEVLDNEAGGLKKGFSVRWQFAPGSRIQRLGERRFGVSRGSVLMEVQVSADWAEVLPVTEQAQVAQVDPVFTLAGSVSPAFRRILWAPYLKLVARPGEKPCVFQTTFLASPF